MKKILCTLLALALLLLAIGCRRTDTPEETKASSSTADTGGETIADSPEQTTEELLLDVLYSKKPFLDTNGASVYLYAYEPQADTLDPLPISPQRYTLVDLDQDGETELVVEVSSSYGLYLVFHRDGQNVYVFEFGVRSFHELKQDGSFIQSSGAFETGFAHLQFEGDGYTVIEDAYSHLDEDEQVYRIGGAPATADEMDAFTKAWSGKPDAVWLQP